MMEVIILVRAVSDLLKLVRTREDRPFCATRGSFAAAKYWSVAIVGSSVLISIPPLNAIIHGTYAVTGHAMGATIGIDTMILLGAAIWIVGEYLRAREGDVASDPLHCTRMRWSVVGVNVGVALLVLWLHVAGVVTGVTRMRLAPAEAYVPPAWLGASSGAVFALTGAVAFVFFASVLTTMIPLAFRSFRTADSA